MKRSRPEEWLFPQWTSENKFSKGLDECLFYDCMYNARKIVDESEEFVAGKLREIEREIDKLPEAAKAAYYVALEQEIKQNTHYVRSRKFLLLFLRAENFVASKAAVRLAKFLEYKLDLFGPEKLPRRIRQDDLNDDDKKVLLSGFLHFGGVDCGGRLVFMVERSRLRLFGLSNEHYIKSSMRVSLYQAMFAIEENGHRPSIEVVCVRWSLNSNLSLRDYRILFLSSVKLWVHAIPIKVAAVHSCCSNSTTQKCVSFIQAIVQNSRDHLSAIHGPYSADCLSELSKYGIDIDSLPISTTGEYKVEVHKKQLEQMRRIEDKRHTMHSELVATNRFHDMQQYRYPTYKAQKIFVAQDEVEGDRLSDNDLNDSAKGEDPPKTCSGELKAGNRKRTISSKDSTRENLVEDNLPVRLMSILERNSNPEAIWWSLDGAAFTIDKEKFQSTVLPNEFKGIKIDSFLRRLRRWGFKGSRDKKETNFNIVDYQHSSFRRHMPELLINWDVQEVPKQEKLPLKLMNIICSNTASHAIWWVCDGEAFAIEKDKFSYVVLDKHFKGVKPESFYRMLRRWGFKRLTDEEKVINNALVFQHSMFKKNSLLTKELLDKWIHLDGLVQVSTPKGERFLKKIHTLLEDKAAEHAIWWVNGGNAFAIHTEHFSSDVLPQHYNGVKLCSFRRSLKRWGFEKLETDDNVTIFQHPVVRKDSPELLNETLPLKETTSGAPASHGSSPSSLVGISESI